MGGLGAETLGTETLCTETSLVLVLVLVPVRPKMSSLEKVSVSWDFIQKSRSLSLFHETQNESLCLGLDITRPKLKVSVLVSIMISSKSMFFSIGWFFLLVLPKSGYVPGLEVKSEKKI